MSYQVYATVDGKKKVLYTGTDLHSASNTYRWAQENCENAVLIRR